MSTRTLLTTEQFERLPKPEVGSYELDHGELIYVSPNDLRHNRVRDIAFMATDQIQNINPDGVLRLVPRLVVEVLSPGNAPDEVARKIQLYKNAGVAAVWILDPATRKADVHK